MKTTDKKIKEFDTVKTFREIKDKISKDIQGMTFEQVGRDIRVKHAEGHNLPPVPARFA